MKEIIIKVRRMPEDRLKEFDKGQWVEAYEVSDNDFKDYYKMSPVDSLGSLIDAIKKYRDDI